MKTLKKQISILLAILMLMGTIAVMPISASAQIIGYPTFSTSHNLGKALVGDKVIFDCDAADDNPPLTYSLYVDNVLAVESDKSEIAYTFEKAGRYEVEYMVTNCKGEYVILFDRYYNVTEPTEAPLITLITYEYLHDYNHFGDDAGMKFKVNSVGGAGNTQYQYTLYPYDDYMLLDDEDKKTIVYKSDYISESEFILSDEMLIHPEHYCIEITAKDKEGNISKAESIPFCYDEPAGGNSRPTETTPDEAEIRPEYLDSFIETLNTTDFIDGYIKIDKDNIYDYVTVYKCDDEKIIYNSEKIKGEPSTLVLDGYMFPSDSSVSSYREYPSDKTVNYPGFKIFYPKKKNDKTSWLYYGTTKFKNAVNRGWITLEELADLIPGAKKMTEQDYIELFRKSGFDVTKVINLGDLVYAKDNKAPEQTEWEDVFINIKFHGNSKVSPKRNGLFYISGDRVYNVIANFADEINSVKFIERLREAEKNGEIFNFSAEFSFGKKAEECMRLINEKYPAPNGLIMENYCEIDDYSLCKVSDSMMSADECFHVRVGDYLVFSPDLNSPYDLGYFIIRDGKCYTLEEAYDQKVIDDEDLDKIVEKLENAGTFKLSPVEKEFLENREDLSRKCSYFDNSVLADLGEAEGYKVYYSHFSEGEAIVNFGNYEIRGGYYYSKSALGVYLYKDGEFTTFEQAWKDGIVNDDNIDKFVELLKADEKQRFNIKDKRDEKPKSDYKDITDVVPKFSQTKTLRFYMPEDWRTTYSETYDGKELSSCKPGIYWWEGSYDCVNQYGKSKDWPGYYISKTDEADGNIFVAQVPTDVKQIMFNNMVRTEDNDFGKNRDRYTASAKTSLVTAEGYQPGEDMYGFYPDGLDSVEDMIFVPYKSDVVSLDRVDNGEWFYYYGGGKYGAYKTLAEAEANDAVYSGGKFPEKKEKVEPTTEKVEPTTAEVTTEPQETGKTIKYEDKKVVKPAVKVKAANPIKVSAKAKTVKAKKLAKKARKINAITVKNAVGKVTYKLTSVPKKIKKLVKINSKGVITLAKGKYAKKTYKIKVQVTAAGNTEYTSAKKTVTVKVKVK